MLLVHNTKRLRRGTQLTQKEEETSFSKVIVKAFGLFISTCRENKNVFFFLHIYI